MRTARLLIPAVMLAFLPSSPVSPPPAGLADPPTRVGRLSYAAGAVSLRPGGEDDWADATLNYPLSTGDHLWTDDDGRAEVTLGSTAIRLARYTAFGFLTLDDDAVQVRLSQGSLQVRLRNLEEDDSFEIDTPNGAISLLRPGTYVVDVDPTGDTTILTVRRGQAEVTAAGSAFSVRSDQAATLVGTDWPTYDVHDPLGPDAWENWCASRDRRADDARSTSYVSREMPGYEDLDAYGTWRVTPTYGPVWVPRHAVAGWAPYRYGHWSWVDPWGWTWIDDAPWGFAPFHYGRWVYWNRAWSWVPGRMATVRPVYAPALVVFVGGARTGSSLFIRLGGGGGGIGWFPLAPGEVYMPAYHVSDSYVRRVNVTNVNITNINITNVDMTRVRYRNRDVSGRVTGVGRETFVGGRPVDRNVVVVTRQRLTSAPVVGATAPVAPTRESIFSRLRPGTVRQPPEEIGRRTVVVRNTPAPPPLPFDVREKALRDHPGRPLDDATLGALRARTPTRRADPVRPATPAPPDAGAPEPSRRLRPVRPGLPEPQPAAPAEQHRGRGRGEPPQQPGPPSDGRDRPGERRGQEQDRRGPPMDRAAPPPVQPAPPQAPPAQPPAAPPPEERERPGERRGQPQERRGPPTERPAPPTPEPSASPAPAPAQPPAQPTERPGRPPVERPAPVQPPAAQPPAAQPTPAPTERPAPTPPAAEKAKPERGRRRPEPKAKRDSTERDSAEKKPPGEAL